MQTGTRNLITDVAGIRVGNASDQHIKTGVTVLTAEQAFVASVDVMGGAPGTRETDCLAPGSLVSAVDALVLAGGSAFGLDAASGVADVLHEQGRGYQVGPVSVPIVPAAILFDLINGGNKQWQSNPYNRLGRAALAECGSVFELGSVGAGTGATTAQLKGGLGSASVVLGSGHTIGALVAVNPHGSGVVPNGPHFWAAPFEVANEFGGLGPALKYEPLYEPQNEKLAAFEAKANTTLAIIATDATLDKAQLKRLAMAAQDGMARALVPSHTAFDGDLVFSLSTQARSLSDPLVDQMALGHAAALCLSRAIARGIYLADEQASDTLPTWRKAFGQS